MSLKKKTSKTSRGVENTPCGLGLKIATDNCKPDFRIKFIPFIDAVWVEEARF